MPDIASLVIQIDSSQAQKLTEILGSLDAQGKKVVSTADLLRDTFDKLLALGLGAMFISAVKGAIELESSYVRLAQVANTTASQLSGMALPAATAGISLEGVAQSIAKLNREVGNAQFGQQGNNKSLLDALGLDISSNADPAERFAKLASVLVNMKDQNLAATISFQLLGRSYAEIKPFLFDLVEQGGIHARVTNEQAEAAKKFEDSIISLRFQMQQNTNQFVNDALPSMQHIVEAFTDLYSQRDRAESFGGAAGRAFQYVAAAAGAAWIILRDVGDGMGALAAQAVALTEFDFEAIKRIGEERDAQAAKSAAELDRFLGKMTAPPQPPTPGTAEGGGGSTPGARGTSAAEKRSRVLLDEQKHYQERVAALKGFGDLYAQAIKTANTLAEESFRAGGIDNERTQRELIEQVAANEKAKLQVLLLSLQEQEALQRRSGDVAKAAETVQQIAQINAQLVANEAITQARIQSLHTVTRQKQQEEYNAWQAEQLGRAQTLVDSFKSQEQLEKEAYQKKLDALEVYLAENADQINNAEQLRENLYQDHMARMNGVSTAYHELEVSSAKGFFEQLSSMMSSHSKSAFEIGKAAAISKAVIDTYTAAQGAYAAFASIPYVGPFLGAAAAAAAIVAGLARVQQIRSTQFGSGSVSSTPTPTFNASPATGQPIAAPVQPISQPSAAQDTILHLHGDNFSAKSIRQLFDALNENSRDGGRVLVV